MEISEFCLCRYPPWHCRITESLFAYLWIPALIFTTVLSHEQTALQELLNYPTTKNCEKMDSSKIRACTLQPAASFLNSLSSAFKIKSYLNFHFQQFCMLEQVHQSCSKILITRY